MTDASRRNSVPFRFMALGGRIAVKAALVGSIVAAFITMVSLSAYDIWRNGWQASAFGSNGFEGFLLASGLTLVSFVILWFVAFVLSSFPAFIGGALIAWLLSRQSSPSSNSMPSKLHPGALIGASAGAVLIVAVLVPADLLGRKAHGGLGYNPIDSLQTNLFYATQLMVIATIAGVWTYNQLRGSLENSEVKNIG